MKSSYFLTGFLLCLAGWSGAVQAGNLPERLVPSELARIKAAREEVGGPFPGLTLSMELETPVTDGKYNQTYHASSFGYIAERAGENITGYARRFAVYAPDKDALPTAKRVSKLLLLLYGMNRERMRFDHFRNAPTVEVWLTRSAGTGLDASVAGEQFKNQIYLYNLMMERRPVEWVREIAHEYGHYAMPYVSGFTEPEEWGNGVLGERLFVKWLSDGLRAGRLKPEEVPFASPDEIETFVAKQVSPLIRRFAREGVDPKRFAKRDATGMDTFTGFVLTLDALYGSSAVRSAFAYTSSSQGNSFITSPDVLRGAEAALKGASEITLMPPLLDREDRNTPFFVYLPRGEFTVDMEGAVKAWRFSADAKGVTALSKSSLVVSAPGWRKLTLTFGEIPENSAPGRLVLRRRGTEVP